MISVSLRGVNLADIPAPVFTDRRSTSIEVHKHLRNLILDSTLPPGTPLKQAELARMFGTSRTPLREAFRMLQEEGLIDADLNQAGRVRGFDPNEIEQLYAARIALEALGVRVSTGYLTDVEMERGRSLLVEMQELEHAGDMAQWGETHRRFHATCMARIAEPMVRTVTSFSERSERYLRLYQVWHPHSFSAAHDEHEAILEAVGGSNPAAAASLMADHLAHTALTVLGDLAPNANHHAVVEAVTMVAGRRRRRS
ncbi:GntR family transcriptional regulator [Rhodococcoides fascians A21d2]|uniref:GntR family transcriptional regulator n=1 Tax=Rhodococcoides fascians TaxID=1828 RepID=UPI00068EE5CA|nr:GntR family transcriptional regulator [Rhodococcus fascians]QII00308.1 GntR family transcriptional regulator [Rhodococcus fascians A21d2]